MYRRSPRGACPRLPNRTRTRKYRCRNHPPTRMDKYRKPTPRMIMPFTVIPFQILPDPVDDPVAQYHERNSEAPTAEITTAASTKRRIDRLTCLVLTITSWIAQDDPGSNWVCDRRGAHEVWSRAACLRRFATSSGGRCSPQSAMRAAS